MRPRKTPTDLRSHRWFGKDDLRSSGHRSRARQQGYTADDMAGKPVIAILNTWSDANPCHAHFRLRAEDVKRGVWQAGGFPMEIPLLTLGETFMKPTTMLYRNLLAMETEEALRAYPADGAILLGGCDKTVPAMVMGATSANLPFIFVPAGPMFRGNWRGQALGSGTDVWKYWAERRAGTIDECTWREMEEGIARSFGTCMTMGTASTMAAAVDALGLTLPGASSIPAADSAHARMASAAGRRIVEMVWEDARPRDILTTAAFENAVTAAMALGGSTNAIIHLIAMAGRAGAELDLDRFDALSRRTPFLANIRPSGAFLMEDFFYAGGLRGVLDRLRDLLHVDCLTVNGQPLGEEPRGARSSRTTRSSPDARVRSDRKAASPCCAATWRRMARSSSTRRLNAGCSSTPDPRSSFATTTTSRRGSTIRHCPSPPTRCSSSRMPGRSARLACPSGACCRSRRSSSRRASATWSGSPTRA